MTRQSLEAVLHSKKQVIPYFTCGDFSLSYTYDLVCQTFAQGVDVLELGIPFSDPIADGPVIQASHQRALLQKPSISIDDAFRIVNQVMTTFPNKHIVFMLAVNLILQYGIESFFKSAKKYQLSGVIIPDLPVEASQIYYKQAQKSGVNLIQLVSPLCDKTRLKHIVQASSGFVYLISSTGITGERNSFSTMLSHISAQIKQIKPIPIGVGFGVSQPAHVHEIHHYADAAIIGSHLINQMSMFSNDSTRALGAVKQRLDELMS